VEGMNASAYKCIATKAEVKLPFYLVNYIKKNNLNYCSTLESQLAGKYKTIRKTKRFVF